MNHKIFQVFAADIFVSTFCNDASNQQLPGMQFRNKVTNDNDIPKFPFFSRNILAISTYCFKVEEKFSNEFHMNFFEKLRGSNCYVQTKD